MQQVASSQVRGAAAAVTLAMAMAAVIPSLSACGRSDPAQLQARAEQLIAGAQFEQAQGELSKIVVAGKDTVEVRELLAQASLGLGDLEGAEHHLARAAALGASDPEFFALKTQAFLAGGKYREALAMLAEHKAHAIPGRPLLEAEAWIGLRDFAQALQALSVPELTAKPVARARLLRAQALGGSGDTKGSRDELVVLLTENPGHPEASLLLAEMSLREGDAASALQPIDAALARLPANVADSWRASLLLARANIGLSSGRTEDARQALAELKQTFPGAPATRLLAARLAVIEGNSRNAVSDLRDLLVDQPEDAGMRMLLAVALADSGNLNQAEQQLVSILNRQPDNSEARLTLARLQLRQGRVDSAQALLESGQHGPEESALLGEIKLRLGDSVAAIGLLRASMASRPQDTARALDLAEVYLQSGDTQQAADTLQRIPAVKSAERARYQQLAFVTTVLGAGGNVAPAIEAVVRESPDDLNLRLLAAGVYGNALGRVDDARRHLAVVRRLAPQDSRATLALARLETRAGNRDAARAAYLDALRIDKDDANAIAGLAWLAVQSGDSGEVASWRTELARLDGPRVRVESLRLALLQRDTAGAGRAEAALLRETAEPAIASYAIGNVYLDAGQPREAREHLRKAAEARSDVPEYWLKLAEAEISIGAHLAAEQNLLRAMQIRPGWTLAARQLVRVSLLQRNPARALRVIADLPQEGAGKWALQVLEADTLAAVGRYADSLPKYEAALQREFDRGVLLRWVVARRSAGIKYPEEPLVAKIERSPNDVALRLMLANFYLSTNRGAEAVEHYRKVLALQPANTIALNNLAWLLFEGRSGTLAEAIGFARRAAIIEPRSASVLDTLGWLLYQDGKRDEALAVLARAVALEPENQKIGAHLSEVKKSSPRPSTANN